MKAGSQASGGAHKRIGAAQQRVLINEVSAGEGSLEPFSTLSGGFEGSWSHLRCLRAKANVGWLIYASWTVPFEGQGPLEPEKTKS